MASRCRLDHIAVTAPDLARGVEQVEELLGAGSAVQRLDDVGCRLRRLELRHPEPARLEALLRSIGFADDLVAIAPLPASGSPQLVADIDTPSGPRQLGA